MIDWLNLYWYAKVYQGNTTESIILVKGSLYTLLIKRLGMSAINEQKKHEKREKKELTVHKLIIY